MKKVFALMMTMAMAFSMAACGGSEEPAEASLVMQEAGNVSMLVPADFEDFAQYEGMIGAPGPGGSIIVADPWIADVTAAGITEDNVLDMVVSAYPDAVVLEYENPAEIGGTEAVYFTIEGKNAAEGTENTVTYVLLFYMMDDVMYEQDLCFTYSTDEGTSLEANLPEIIDSITIG